MRNERPSILLTGATGYIGGRLLRILEQDERYGLRCVARTPENVRLSRPHRGSVIRGDLLDKETLDQAVADVDTAYFLVHALGAKAGFEDQERESARNFALAAKKAGIRKIIYLGGLGKGESLSPHLRTRHEVGELLKESGAVVIEFRASIIIGSGSLSFELVRALTEKLPFMITPRWVYSKAQPVAVEDVLQYLIQALDSRFNHSQVFEIGGPDQVAYVDLISEYARQRGYKRRFIPVPFLSPHLSSLWLGLVTPVYARVGKKLVESLAHDTIVTDNSALHAFAIQPIGFSQAISRALLNEDREMAETRWCDSVSSAGVFSGGKRFGSRIIDVHKLTKVMPPEKLFAPINEIGGRNGWFYLDFLWKVRGAIDLIVGGVGMRRGRPPRELVPGDPLDFWRVEKFERNRLLLLRAEMKLPGRAWLQFEVIKEGDRSTLTQTAIFDPRGIPGLLYWYLLYPAHAFIFKGMLKAIGERAVNRQRLTTG